QLLAAPVPTTTTLLLTPPHRPIQPPTHLRPPRRDINHQFTVALDPDTRLYHRLSLYTGKRVTSAQSRERRCKERKGNSRAWIRSCLLSKDPLRLRSVDSKSLLVETILSPAHSEPIVVTGLIDSGAPQEHSPTAP